MRFETVAEDLRQHEGWRPHAYKDHLGFLTIGYGQLIDERRGGGMPRAVGEFWLSMLIDDIDARLMDRLPWYAGAPDDVQRALINMGYQLGISGLLRFRNMLSALEAGDYPAAADHALDSRWAEQTPNRAAEVAGWIRSAA